MKATSKSLAFAVIGTAALLSTFSANAAQAASVSYSANTGDYLESDWTKTLTVNKFDTSLGKLTGITFSLNGNVVGGAGIENLSSSKSAVKAIMGSEFKLYNDSVAKGAALVVALPTFSKTFDLAKYDKKLDFGGTSGISVNDLSATKSENTSYDASYAYFNDLASLVSGSGQVSFDVDANATSTASGSGNLVSTFNTSAMAAVTVTYTYDVPVPPSNPVPPQGIPEPEVLIGSLVAAFLGFQFRKRYSQAKTGAKVQIG
jgi:hypothetical protein